MVPPRSQMDVTCKILHRVTPPRGRTGPMECEPAVLSCGLLVARTLMEPSGNCDFPVRVMNVDSNPKFTRQGSVVSDLEPVSVESKAIQEADDQRGVGSVP